jgi:hypothetical protein
MHGFFVDLYGAGTFLLNGTLIFLIFAVVAIIGLHCQTVQEEVSLTQAYGQAYAWYCARTKRYLGWHDVAGQGIGGRYDEQEIDREVGRCPVAVDTGHYWGSGA